MCQVLDTGQWVLKGMLNNGGSKCYGPFLYTRVFHYSDWIVATTVKQGMPVSPILVSKYAAFATTKGQYKGVATPWMKAKAINLTASTTKHQIQEGSEGSQEPVQQGRVLPVYYDYYSGELYPISTATFSQPLGRRGKIHASFLLQFLILWVTS